MAPSAPASNEADDFVNIWMTREGQASASSAQRDHKDFYSKWLDQASGKLAIPVVTGYEGLRTIYPNHSIVSTQGWNMSILGFPGASVTPIEKTPLITNLVFIPLSRSAGLPGVLIDDVQYGGFKVSWKQFEYIVYTISYPVSFGNAVVYFILHEGPEEVSRLFLLAAGAYADDLHDEIWVFNQGFWQKDHNLWLDIQDADWKDVILKDEFKKALQKDIYGFFESEAIYKELAIPWKRGLIMYGPPGNGKTISLKVVMKTCDQMGFIPLYVKSFQSWMGEEGSMAEVFRKARQRSPCVIILEDLDSLINNQNRSFFLNQLDGLEGNDGLLIIGTTNHLDRLDPGLSSRPSRFDRKYNFDNPDEEERALYCKYWQNKLAPNNEIEFPDSLLAKIAGATDKFSFAYLKEAFVSTLVTLAGIEGEKPTFESAIMKQIESLRGQIDKSILGVHALGDPKYSFHPEPRRIPGGGPARPTPPPSTPHALRAILDALSDRGPSRGNSAPSFDPLTFRAYGGPGGVNPPRPGGAPAGNPASETPDDETFRVLLDRLALREDPRLYFSQGRRS